MEIEYMGFIDNDQEIQIKLGEQLVLVPAMIARNIFVEVG
jgi:hypothetical protein